MFNVSIKYAAICSVFLIILFHVSAYFGINPLMNVAHLIFDLIIFGVFIFFGSKEFKTEQQDEILHFWQGMTIGFNVYFFGTIFFGIYLFIYFQIDENVLIGYKEAATTFLMEKKDIYIDRIGQEAFDSQVESIDDATSNDLLLSSVLKKILAGFFITPVISIILRKQPK
jgi:hypothetical protein